MTKDKALRLALEALENLFGIPDKWTGEGGGDVAVWRLGGSYRAQEAIKAIKAALEAKDEPVAWMREDGTLHFADKNIFYVGQPFYTTPPQRKPLTDEEVRKVARLFSNRVAEMCNVDADDHWKYHSEEVVDDVKFVLKAAHGIKGEA